MWGQTMEDDLARIEKIFGKVKQVDSEYEVFASAKIYPKLIKVFIPNHPYKKQVPFMEPHIDELDGEVEDWATRVETSELRQIENLIRSLRRSKTLISDYVLCNEFDLFATFTFSPEKSDRFNPDAVKLQMANWLRNQRNRTGRFKYLIVPEFHKDRKALHFHALLKDYKGELVEAGRTHKGRQLYHFKNYTLGFNSAVPIDDVEKVSSYVKKYLTKDMPQFRDKRRFWNSLNLAKPRVIDNPENIDGIGVPDHVFTNEYGRILYYTRNDSDKEVLAP